jgi:hypothetical protein
MILGDKPLIFEVVLSHGTFENSFKCSNSNQGSKRRALKQFSKKVSK